MLPLVLPSQASTTANSYSRVEQRERESRATGSGDSLHAHGALLIRDRRVLGSDVAVDKVPRELHAIREWGTGAVGGERQPGLRGFGVGPRRGPG